MTPAERAKRLEEIRDAVQLAHYANPEVCAELGINAVPWLLAELAAAEQTIKRYERLIDGILVRCREAVGVPRFRGVVE